MAIHNLSHHLLAVVVVLLVIQPLVQSSNIKSFQKLDESNKVQKGQGLDLAKSYLTRFGYLSNNQLNAATEEADLEEAVKTYQKNYNLNVTGKLDPSTIKQMAVPRCGVPDKKMGLQYAFFRQEVKWPASKRTITYTFDSSVKGDKLTLLKPACSLAFSAWQKVSPFTFKAVPQGSKADVKVGIYSGDHGDGTPFDGSQGGMLAHASVPNDPSGILHFDADEDFSNNPNPNQFDTVAVALHEIGHILGLDHSSKEDAVMFASAVYGPGKRAPRSDDIQGIKALYK